MTVELLPHSFTVCKVAELSQAALAAPFTFTGRTDAEISLVCPTERAPAGTIAREDGWRAFRVAGSMPFTLTGVLSRLTGLLAQAGVPVFSVSTFDTDYVLVKGERLSDARAALTAGGIGWTDAADGV